MSTPQKFQLASDPCREGPKGRRQAPTGTLVTATIRGDTGRCDKGGVWLSGHRCQTAWGPGLALLLPSRVTLGKGSTSLYLSFLICGIRKGIQCLED